MNYFSGTTQKVIACVVAACCVVVPSVAVPVAMSNDNSQGNNNNQGGGAATCRCAGQTTPNYAIPAGLVATFGDLLKSIQLPDGWAWVNPFNRVGNATAVDGELREHRATYTPLRLNQGHYQIARQIPIYVRQAVLDRNPTTPSTIRAMRSVNLESITPDDWIWVNQDNDLPMCNPRLEVLDTLGYSTFRAMYRESGGNFLPIIRDIEVYVYDGRGFGIVTLDNHICCCLGHPWGNNWSGNLHWDMWWGSWDRTYHVNLGRCYRYVPFDLNRYVFPLRIAHGDGSLIAGDANYLNPQARFYHPWNSAAPSNSLTIDEYGNLWGFNTRVVISFNDTEEYRFQDITIMLNFHIIVPPALRNITVHNYEDCGEFSGIENLDINHYALTWIPSGQGLDIDNLISRLKDCCGQPLFCESYEWFQRNWFARVSQNGFEMQFDNFKPSHSINWQLFESLGNFELVLELPISNPITFNVTVQPPPPPAQYIFVNQEPCCCVQIWQTGLNNFTMTFNGICCCDGFDLSKIMSRLWIEATDDSFKPQVTVIRNGIWETVPSNYIVRDINMYPQFYVRVQSLAHYVEIRVEINLPGDGPVMPIEVAVWDTCCCIQGIWRICCCMGYQMLWSANNSAGVFDIYEKIIRRITINCNGSFSPYDWDYLMPQVVVDKGFGEQHTFQVNDFFNFVGVMQFYITINFNNPYFWFPPLVFQVIALDGWGS